MSRTRVLYTVLIGNYEALMDQPAAVGSGIDMICFTDDPTLTSDTWTVRRVEPAFALDPTRSSRRLKILAHEVLSDYDESLYIDNSVLLRRSPNELLDDLLPSDADMALFRHSFRGSVRDEFDAVVDSKLDARWVCEEQLEHYRLSDPAGLDEQTLLGGILLRRHNAPSVRRLMNSWWDHVARYSKRDQLSLPSLLSRSDVTYVIHDFNTMESEYHEWPRWKPGTERRALTPIVEPAISGAVQMEDRVTCLEHLMSEISASLMQVSEDLATTQESLSSAKSDPRVEELMDSTSWRMTKPLRWISGAVRPAPRRAWALLSNTRAIIN